MRPLTPTTASGRTATPSLRTLLGRLPLIWSSTRFAAPDLADYATPHLERDTRQGVSLLALAALLFLVQAGAFAAFFGLGRPYIQTYVLLAALALHIRFSAARVRDVQALNLLAMALLIVCASALVLLAREAGQLHMMLLLSVATLYMLIPLMPWGLREATLTSLSIYAMFTSLTFFSRLSFGPVELWTLQFTMLTTSLLALALVARALGLRKHNLAVRFRLERASADMAVLAERDHLTGAWNRRFLERDFDRVLAAHAQTGTPACFGLLDIDHFKPLNDTYGHLHGDRVLQALAAAFDDLDGEMEYLVRLGGDEFAFVIAGHPSPVARLAGMLADAATHAEDSCAADAPAPTVSAGMIALDRNVTLDVAYAQADELLYEAKRAGGACIRHSLPTEDKR
ncbi:diguanylate cyclase (GGDEF)-like protein [Pseudoduganella lurida]|uniref:diguanylate cyclase n=1 Tax=Pseudoduganella lurida TaxID=1036180 RepID=A0A562RL31_9BURK|nr:GGDEF domain-containing protein [Pseudoduganella lurida]TWI69757.1 diguanylate cyclase (GGDEF)-like protein [Pseudoduganella lurida]